jgi:DNA polymerase-3 subunit gamma/tau
VPPADLLPTDPEPAQHVALYRRWRAQRFGELVGQDPIVGTLRRAVATDKIAHAYLFVGPRGTGKTSTARILAKAINCTNRGADGEPCDTCPACVSIREGRALDVLEIDAASHGLVDDARELVSRAMTSPSELRRRVYIIDEVHMLSPHAFNALLKLIEEPPAHVVFILATTDTHRVPATIISRTQRFDFRRMATDVIVSKLTRIAEAEGVQTDADALALIGRLADGGMRDAESLLEQVMAYAGDHVTRASVEDAVGLADEQAIGALLDALVAGDTSAALGQLEALSVAGRDFGQVAQQAESEARGRLLATTDPALARRLATILRVVAEAGGAGAREGRARLLLELLSVDVAAPPVSAPVHAVATTPPPPRSEPARRAAAIPVAAEPPTSIPPQQATPVGPRPELDLIRSRWPEVIERATPVIKPLIRESQPWAVDGARLTLAFPEGRDFIRSRISSRSTAIEALLTEVLGGTWAIECVAANIDPQPLSIPAALGPPADAAAEAQLQRILEITAGELVDAPEVH